jgi:hypothetical protein
MGRLKSKLSSLTDEELLSYCRHLYELHGPVALTYKFLKDHHGLYALLFARGLKQKRLAAVLGLEEELHHHSATRPMVRAGREMVRRTWSQLVTEACLVTEEHGSLPPAQWFQRNGRGSLVQAVYSLGYTWDQLRDAVGDPSTGAFVESRNGIRWRSHPEASFSNFLYARGIQHRRGDRYPKKYEELSGKTHGRYDLHFLGLERWVDVEIWGDNPGGHGSSKYQSVRQSKEQFNLDSPRFLGVHFEQCFSEDELTRLLAPHIGTITPFQFERPTDPVIPSTHWSNTDELLEYCRRLAANMPQGAFPTEEWLRKRGKWTDRPGETYNTLSIYIKQWFGGIRQLRSLLGQAHVSTTKWDRATTLESWKEFWLKHGLTPNQVKAHHSRNISVFSADEVKEAGRLAVSVVKYIGSAAEANRILGITVDRKRKRQATIEY